MSAALQQLSAGPGRRNKARPWQTNSNLVDGPVSSGFQLAALDFEFPSVIKKSAQKNQPHDARGNRWD
ncbi:hypothetical protein BB562_06555 [Lactiplantibacillus pentosus]|nr:hypothetical protein BB562_06555 [Lactiplantibacillus pentosus]